MKKSLNILKKFWGYDNFRFPQEEIIHSSILGNDTIALLATGAGKSICFQVTALALDGLCLVISPLIALMDDQVIRLKSMGIMAEAIHSGRSMNDVDRILNNAYYGKLKFLYLSPERLQSDILLARLYELNISLVAIDEAHCISQWGFDFRPSYLKIGEIRDLVKDARFMALTATASPKVLEDIKKHLNLENATIFKTSFLRSNISLNVIDTGQKLKECIRIASRIHGAGIIYVRSRHQTENITKELIKNGLSAMYYHAGLDNKYRQKIQSKWQSGEYNIVVSTNAFGMGIDKADVRFVLHYDVPDKPEEYYQEAGRAGRDGFPATAIMLYSQEDISRMNKFFQQRFPSIEEIKLLFHNICVFLKIAVGSGAEQRFDFDIHQFCDRYNYKLNYVLSGIKTIEYAGWIEYVSVGKRYSSLHILLDNNAMKSALAHHPKAGKMMNSILRMYESIFFEDIDILEGSISKMSGLEEEEVVKLLLAMHKREWVKYDQHLFDSKIFFTGDRPADVNFTINKEHYLYLKTMSKERMKAIKSYISTEKCRQRELLAYFGEILKQDCGNCDICRGTNLTEFSRKDRKNSYDFLQQKLTSKPMSLKDLIYLWPYNKRKRIINLIQILENEKYISIKSGVVYWIHK